ncbi:MAG: serine/threonine protein kinase [Desulfobacteraceae bacterium]|nr:serine/threonine protein kinase [Desulfobacteraceae bacterium]
MTQLFPRKVFANRYHILKKIGRGTTGNIYKAYDTINKHLVAVKQLQSTDPKDVPMLKKEFRQLSMASHNSLVNFYNLHITGNLSFFTMELIDGWDLFEAIRGKTGFCKDSINYDLLRKIIIQVAEGIQYLHNMGILHKDIKPAHIRVTTARKPVLLDFGLAKKFSGHIPEWENLQEINGTFAYMSPEVLQGHLPLPASDWYSLGVVLYECLTGQLPDIILGIDPRPPAYIVPDTPSDLNQMAMAWLDQNAGLRPSQPEIIKRLNNTEIILFPNRCQSKDFPDKIQKLFF